MSRYVKSLLLALSLLSYTWEAYAVESCPALYRSLLSVQRKDRAFVSKDSRKLSNFLTPEEMEELNLDEELRHSQISDSSVQNWLREKLGLEPTEVARRNHTEDEGKNLPATRSIRQLLLKLGWLKLSAEHLPSRLSVTANSKISELIRSTRVEPFLKSKFKETYEGAQLFRAQEALNRLNNKLPLNEEDLKALEAMNDLFHDLESITSRNQFSFESEFGIARKALDQLLDQKNFLETHFQKSKTPMEVVIPKVNAENGDIYLEVTKIKNIRDYHQAVNRLESHIQNESNLDELLEEQAILYASLRQVITNFLAIAKDSSIPKGKHSQRINKLQKNLEEAFHHESMIHPHPRYLQAADRHMMNFARKDYLKKRAGTLVTQFLVLTGVGSGAYFVVDLLQDGNALALQKEQTLEENKNLLNTDYWIQKCVKASKESATDPENNTHSLQATELCIYDYITKLNIHFEKIINEKKRLDSSYSGRAERVALEQIIDQLVNSTYNQSAFSAQSYIQTKLAIYYAELGLFQKNNVAAADSDSSAISENNISKPVPEVKQMIENSNNLSKKIEDSPIFTEKIDQLKIKLENNTENIDQFKKEVFLLSYSLTNQIGLIMKTKMEEISVDESLALSEELIRLEKLQQQLDKKIKDITDS
ncbi:hypothetical protein GW915_13405 [bacterium]|nr:hypothetical protein [bacterium]